MVWSLFGPTTIALPPCHWSSTRASLAVWSAANLIGPATYVLFVLPIAALTFSLSVVPAEANPSSRTCAAVVESAMCCDDVLPVSFSNCAARSFAPG